MLEPHVIMGRANEARELGEDPVFMAICDEILDDAATLFLDANSGIDAIAKAHEGVRAVSKFKDALQRRIDAETFLKKGKGQDRGND